MPEKTVKRRDLRPVRVLGVGSFVVNGGDGGLELVGADRAPGQRVREERDALGDLWLVPERSVLQRERDQLPSGARTRQTPRVGQQHEREQSGDLRVVRLQTTDDSRQAHRLEAKETITTETLRARRKTVLQKPVSSPCSQCLCGNRLFLPPNHQYLRAPRRIPTFVVQRGPSVISVSLWSWHLRVRHLTSEHREVAPTEIS